MCLTRDLDEPKSHREWRDFIGQMTIAEICGEKESLVGKANNFMKHLISNNLEEVSPLRPGSPRSLALEKNHLQEDFFREYSLLTASILNKEQEIEKLPEGEENNETLKLLQSDVTSLKQKAASISDAKLKAIQALDTQIGEKQAEEMEEMYDTVNKFKRIVVLLECGSLQRTFKPVRYFSDLQAQIEALHPGFTVILSVPGSPQVVGSQFELLCAYQDASLALLDILTLKLKLIRCRNETAAEESDHEDSVFERQKGKWTNAETQLFHTGVEHHGWGEWAQIAATVQTRDRKQVRSFSINQKAKRFKASVSVIPALSDLAEGFNAVVRGLEVGNVTE